MPLPISLAHKLAKRLADVRKAEIVPYLRPDGKTQVTVRYVDGRPVEIEKLLISTQHRDGAESLIKDDLWEHVIEPVLPEDLYDARKLHKKLPGQSDRPVRDRRPDGRLRADRAARSSSTRTAAWPGTAVARSPARIPPRSTARAAYAARYVAKNVVAAGLADRCEVQVAYAIGVAHPVSVMVETFGTEKIGRARILELIDEHFDLRPGAFRQYLRLHRPIYPEDRGLRPLRPRRPRLHVGAHRQGRRAPRRRRARRARELSGRRRTAGRSALHDGCRARVQPAGSVRALERLDRVVDRADDLRAGRRRRGTRSRTRRSRRCRSRLCPRRASARAAPGAS